MKTTLKLLTVGTTLAFASLPALAQDRFVGLTWGETSNNMDRSSSLKGEPEARRLDDTINNSGTWGVRAGIQDDTGRMYLSYEYVSDTYSGSYKMRQQNLLGSYDLFLPVADNTRLFGGVTAGLVKLEQDSPGYHRDSDLGLAGGLQVGVLHSLAPEFSIEGGYRYLRTTADASLNARDRSVGGSFDLKSSDMAYLGLNYHF
ncbi:outer membrane beta-barrel protein [Halopseudomonas bauzanensis]|uniref:Outer membrane protein beta-barrel domain-containing protein n=1 Tax=Halopseudomonas bauzanensis TaxID=653930 RepID=A0A1I4KF96_9GAMM|nr:outer membrane beta-barrel protein [Halopseudomonas bauzanensis]SER40899.1 Outer membrane protein beta-barrel domain-containing protein [Halopseudomonas bauzanensis]SFL77418.1 Outer membrane protein beta-barrel domain-containing protein [Halopseudomonas bauzanensis]